MVALEAALAIDPGSLVYQRDRGRFLYFARRYDEAIVQLKRVIELDENFGTAYPWLWSAYEMKGDNAGAFETFIKAKERSDPERVESYQRAYETAGWPGVRRKHVEFLKLNENGSGFSSCTVARQCALLGEKEQAFSYLTKAIEKREGSIGMLNVEPVFDNLRGDPRFDELVRRIGL